MSKTIKTSKKLVLFVCGYVYSKEYIYLKSKEESKELYKFNC
jgi:hypothetical protein